MHGYPNSLKNLIETLCSLPGVGPKTAQRMAFSLLGRTREEVEKMARILVEAKIKTNTCALCGNFTDEEVCSICTDSRRNQSLLCVVQESRDILTIERAEGDRGLYHVLHGALAPLEDVGPEDLNIDLLVERVKEKKVKEVIVATNPNAEGDATAVYIARVLKPLGVKVTRIGFGLPIGGDLEYADERTLTHALASRREI